MDEGSVDVAGGRGPGRTATGGAPAADAPGWHAGPALVAAYATGRAGELDSWSMEAHLTGCAMCRAEVGAALHASGSERDRDLLAQGRAGLLAALPTAGPASPRVLDLVAGGRRRRAAGPRVHRSWLLRPLALLAVAVAVAAAVVLAVVVDSAAGGGTGDGARVLWLFAPLIPVAGVALCSTDGGDPWREVVLSTPSVGLRLVLWRTAVVLSVAVPSALAAGWVMAGSLVPGGFGGSGPWPVLWLLPCLALTSTTLALGSVMLLERAAWVVGGLWAAVLLAPVVLDPATAGVDAADRLVASASRWGAPLLSGAAAQSGWALIALGAMAVVVLRRSSYEQMSALPRPAAL